MMNLRRAISTFVLCWPIGTMLAGPVLASADLGCLPDNQEEFVCGRTLMTAARRLAIGLSRCRTQHATAAFEGEPFDLKECEQSRRDSFFSAVQRTVGTCSPHSMGQATPIGSTFSDKVGESTGDAFCDPTSGIPLDPESENAGFVPSSDLHLSCSSKISRGLAKLLGSMVRCRSRAARALLQGLPFDEEACRDEVLDTFGRLADRLLAQSACPVCLDRSTLTALGGQFGMSALEDVPRAFACQPQCGDGKLSLGEACDPPGSACPGATQCSSTCSCASAVIDSSGEATEEIATRSSALAALSGLVPYAQYDIWVHRRGADRSTGSYLRLTADSSGMIPPTILGYNLEEGDYEIEVEPVVLDGAASRILEPLGFAVREGSGPEVMVTDASGALLTAIAPGADLYATARRLSPGQPIDLYVVDDQPMWKTGDPLVDRSGSAPDEPTPDLPRSRVQLSGTPERVVVAGDGTIAATRIWQAVAGVGGAFDVVVDVDRNGSFDLGVDVASDHLTTGVVVQSSGVPAFSRGGNGDFVANLSVDPSCRPRDAFTLEEDVKVLINPPTRMQLGGDRYVRKYVLEHKEEWSQGDSLLDVSGPNRPWEADTVQQGCTNEGCVLVWPGPLRPGEYDVVIDVNRNGTYDAGVDILDGGACPGFVVRETLPEPKKWTILVYVDGDNDLEPFAIEDINEMEAIGSSEDVNVVVQVDRIPGFDGSNGNWTETRRYYIERDDDPSTIGSRRLACPNSELNMADPDVLQEFVSWGAANYPAERYALVLWNHGRGFRQAGQRLPAIHRDIIWDDTDGGSLDMPEIEQALRGSGVTLDLLGYDACLMAMTEISHQMRDVAAVSVFSQDLEPGDGWPYDTILADLVAAPTMSGDALGEAIVERYEEEYSGDGGITLSSVQNDDDLAEAVSEFAEAMIAGMGVAGNVLTAQRTLTQRFVDTDPLYDDFRDLADYARRVRDNVTGQDTESAAIRATAQAVIDQVGATVALETHSTDLPTATGLSIWLPSCQFLSNNIRKYGQLRFARDTRWDEFLAGLCGELFRVELTWGASPSDLDSHLWDAGTPPQHLSYRDREIDGANLDVDDTSGFGPENVRVNLFRPGPRGQYDYAVHHYSGGLPPSAPIVVRVFRGSSVVPVATFTRTSWPISNGFWHVFSVDATTLAITPRDTMASAPPFGLPRSPAGAAKSAAVE